MKFVKIKKGAIYYYSSARFRELQLDYIIHGEKPPFYPTDKNFFIGPHATAILYSSVIDDRNSYYYNRYNRYGYDNYHNVYGINFDITHVYRVKKDTNLLDLMDRDSITELLFQDVSSPFHISKASNPVHDVILHHEFKKLPKAQDMGKKYNIDIKNDKYGMGGFALLAAATGYFNEQTTRNSHYIFDFTLIELLRQYFQKKNISCDGWYQPEGKFKEEVAFFNPEDSLEPDFDHPKSWSQALKKQGMDISKMSLYRKQKLELDLIVLWRKSEIEIINKNIKRLETLYKNAEEGKRDDILLMIKENKNRIEFLMTYIPDFDKDFKVADILKNVFGIKKLDYYTAKVGLQKFINKQTMSCEFGNCAKSVISFESCQVELNELAQEMELYINANNNHHLGARVSDHAVWVTRALHKWLGYKDHPWTMGIENGLRNLTLVSAFLHDIGKIGDTNVKGLAVNTVKPEHPIRGYEYLMEQSKFLSASGEDSKKLYNVINKCNLFANNFTLATIAVTAAMHHHFGELLMAVEIYLPADMGQKLESWEASFMIRRTEKQYFQVGINFDTVLGGLMDTLVEYKYIIFMFDFFRYYHEAGGNIYNKAEVNQSLNILLAVCAADVYGAHPVEDDVHANSIYNSKLSDLLDPQILHYNTARHKEGPSVNTLNIFRPYYTYLYYTLGLQERDHVMTFAESIVDPGAFLEGWTNFKGLIQHIKDKNRRLPTIFSVMNTSSTEEFITDLFRLLKAGQVPQNNHISVKKLSDTIINELMELFDSENPSKHPLVSKFITHRNLKWLAKQEPEILTNMLNKDLKQRLREAPF